jgi:hypothetical protein
MLPAWPLLRTLRELAGSEGVQEYLGTLPISRFLVFCILTQTQTERRARRTTTVGGSGAFTRYRRGCHEGCSTRVDRS